MQPNLQPDLQVNADVAVTIPGKEKYREIPDPSVLILSYAQLGTETGPDTQSLGEMLWRDLHPSQAVNPAPRFISGPAIPIHSAAMVPEYLPLPEPVGRFRIRCGDGGQQWGG